MSITAANSKKPRSTRSRSKSESGAAANELRSLLISPAVSIVEIQVKNRSGSDRVPGDKPSRGSSPNSHVPGPADHLPDRSFGLNTHLHRLSRSSARHLPRCRIQRPNHLLRHSRSISFRQVISGNDYAGDDACDSPRLSTRGPFVRFASSISFESCNSFAPFGSGFPRQTFAASLEHGAANCRKVPSRVEVRWAVNLNCH